MYIDNSLEEPTFYHRFATPDSKVDKEYLKKEMNGHTDLKVFRKNSFLLEQLRKEKNGSLSEVADALTTKKKWKVLFYFTYKLLIIKITKH